MYQAPHFILTKSYLPERAIAWGTRRSIHTMAAGLSWCWEGSMEGGQGYGLYNQQVDLAEWTVEVSGGSTSISWVTVF